MIEVRGDLWDYNADFTGITTNGTVKTNGKAVMGRGCAREAMFRFDGIDAELGERLQMSGNHVHVISWGIFTFPVKHNWWEKADLDLIERSAHEVMEWANDLERLFANEPLISTPTTFVLPRPGCGNGGLRWEDVKPRIEPILDDRIHIITW